MCSGLVYMIYLLSSIKMWMRNLWNFMNDFFSNSSPIVPVRVLLGSRQTEESGEKRAIVSQFIGESLELVGQSHDLEW
jgi:hypothetical protein